MGYLYHVLEGCDVFVLKVTTTGEYTSPVQSSDVIWFDEREKVWRSSSLNRFRPPKENH